MLVQGYEVAQRWHREGVAADGRARDLVAEDHAVGGAPVDQGQRDAGVARMDQRALPLDEHDVALLGALHDEVF